MVVSGEAAHARWPVHWQPPRAVVLLRLPCHKEFLGEPEVTAKDEGEEAQDTHTEETRFQQSRCSLNNWLLSPGKCFDNELP